MREVCRLLGISKLRTTAYKASTNAAIERLHSTLNNMLGKVVSDNQKDWCSYLPYVMAAYRSTQHSSTGYTPNYLMLGREVKGAVDVLYGTMPDNRTPSSYDNFAEEVELRMKYAYAVVRENLAKAAQRYAYYYDLRVRPQTFHVGQRVWYFH